MKTTTKPTDFREALKLAILAYIKRAKAEGTTAMSAGCLKQCVTPPSRFLDGAPSFYAYPQMFGEVLAECGGRFVIANTYTADALAADARATASADYNAALAAARAAEADAYDAYAAARDARAAAYDAYNATLAALATAYDAYNAALAALATASANLDAIKDAP